MDRIERAEMLDGVAEALRRAVRAVPLGKGRDLLHGRWLGHPVHPVLVQVPVGAWISAEVLDWTPGGGRAAGLLIAVGLGGALPAAAAGLVDWAELEPEQARVGLLHAALNVGALTCYAVSLTARLTGHPLRGRAYALAGLCTVCAAAAAGGHLAYRQASGANHADAVPRLVPPGWHSVGPVNAFPQGQPVRRMVGQVPVAVVRTADGSCHALADLCSHDGGPLSEGNVVDDCLHCPWHGSAFRLADGWNTTGPATAPQPAFDTRTADGELHVRLRTPPSGSH
ncbi:Ferredoxin subunit of nitrite reductase or a ring-hydroxylating dioxygenase [Actinacidiphila yanglinensis]|uniref:Ferredoxin subunit of nitrite reductase or a ring-hydroxylating dioxygenase n=1 Tax=Actinacidiphila yanglinensis TaxID=310779 RepID=A0A1H6EET4_9ACTN|nr:Rieske (2Fe-2S) protein [Actinacidiphila yanglinensis]SEG95781.1 Ferredoxin subunit of nitrite reductase or a ring-hydroxylating dioxygenase [Actinacidiphila yanglinensis]